MKKLSAWFCAGLCLIAVLLPLGVAVGDLPRCGEGEWALEWPWLLLPVLILTVAGVLVRLRCRPFWLRPGQLAAVLLTALLYDLVGNLETYAEPAYIPATVLMTAGVLLVLWALLKRWAAVLWVPFLLLEAIQCGAYMQYGTTINSLVLAEAFESSWEEASAYITPGNLAAFAGALVAVALLVWIQWRVLRRCRRIASLGTGGALTALASACLAVLPEEQREETYYWPAAEGFKLAEMVSEAIDANVDTIDAVMALQSPTDQPSSTSVPLPADAGAVLVVHVGESVMAHRMSINGYERDTTPWLRSCPYVVNFPRCVSAACDTCRAEIAILTNARRSITDPTPGMQATTGSVLDLFTVNGFKMYTFFGRRCAQKLKYDRVVRVLTRRSAERFNAPGSPWTAVPQMQQVLRDHPRENLLFFVNNEGSHVPFYHFDHDAPPFAPCVDDFASPTVNGEGINNAYDSTVHYTDEFFRRVCESLKGRPFVYLYVSDHGEYLGRDGMWGRGALGDKKRDYHSTEGCMVGMFIIISPEFAALNPHFAESLQQLRAHTSMTVAHEHIFHTLLGLFGIRTPYYEEGLDLCSPAARPYDGPRPDHDN
ncbi:MAG: sulfatase-like hydrolase/transferase [Akkermansia muciniphila]